MNPPEKSSLWSQTSTRGKIGMIVLGISPLLAVAPLFDPNSKNYRVTDALGIFVMYALVGLGLVWYGRKVLRERQARANAAPEPTVVDNSLRKLEGLGKTLTVSETDITIMPTGFLGIMDSINSGGITIPISSITAIQHKDGGSMRHGFMHFGMLSGGRMAANIDQAVDDPNTITFPASMNAQAREIKTFIEAAMAQTRVQSSSSGASVADEVSRLADLRSKGVLTEEEFTKAKNKILTLQ